MLKRRIVITATVLLLAVALAQDAPSNIETRLSIVENRLGRLEADVSRLSEVPTALARIEEKLTALSDRTSGNSNVLQSVGMSVVTLVIGGAIGDLIGRRRQK